MSEKDFFSVVYAVQHPSDCRRLYNEWAVSYDADVIGNGYATPLRCARALAEVVDDKSEPILDFGCGTGISGAALRSSGFRAVDGCDISAGMLEQARQKNIYRQLWELGEGEDLPREFRRYRHIAAVGAISIGAAPVETMGQLLEILPPQGTLTFSFNDHTLDDPSFASAVTDFVDNGTAKLLFREYGEHLPELGLKSMVYVMTKV